MNQPTAFNPDDLQFVGKTPEANQSQKEPNFAPTPSGRMSGVKPSNEVGALDENTILDMSETPEELPGFEPLPEGTYDCYIDTVKWAYSQKGNLTIYLTFKVLTPGFEKRVILWNITPGNEFGLTRYKQLLKRAVATNPTTGDQFSLWEKANKVSIKQFVESGMAINARVRLKGKPKESIWEGEKRINFNITDVKPPKTANFL